MASYQVVLRGKAVNIIYQHGKQQPLPLGLSIKPEFFNEAAADGKWVKRSHTQADELNVLIAERLGDLKSYVNQYMIKRKKFPAPDSLRGFFKKTRANDLSFAALWAQFRYHQGHKGTDSVSLERLQDYDRCLAYLTGYKADIDIDTINVGFYDGFKQYLHKDKKCGHNRSCLYINILKAFLHWAIDADKTTLQERLVRKFKTDWDQRDIIFNTMEELQQICNLDIEALELNKKTKGFLTRVRDCFILQSLTGFRHSDSKREIEWSIHNNFLRLCAQKTRAEITLPLRGEVLALLHKYQSQNRPFPTYQNQPYNRGIKQLARLAGITQLVVLVHGRQRKKAGQHVPKCDLMSSHNARANFICNMIKNNVHTQKIMEMTGIMEENTIKHYAAVMPSELEKDMAMVEARSPLYISHLAKSA